ncbi:MAG: GH25 family lysozyme [Phoenicibacter congonensis]|uniref:GH25 family lysozyme n=1 Tax=Phoenicibacter congonensis TaxID=1944646 RepID=A0AA43UAW5_9ACTN|nr:GH25 family lysozyme [Phoenicibacter congonensis]
MPKMSRRNFLKLAASGCFVAATAFSATALSGCSSNETASTKYQSPYDFSGLSISNFGATYTENGALKSKFGIDVSDYQGDINWTKVKNAGVDFVFVRLGYRGSTKGLLYEDENYIQNIQGATNAGLEVGAYFFSQAANTEEASEEAAFCLSLLSRVSAANGTAKPITLPLVFDHEPTAGGTGRADTISRSNMTEIATQFCKDVAISGYRPMIYGNSGDIDRYERETLLDSLVAEGYPRMQIWFAEYNSNTPTGQFDFSIWQYSNSGQIDGIDTNVDLNILFTTTFS